MSRIVLVHWHEQEAQERAARLQRHGHEVLVHWQQDAGSPGALRSVTQDLPDVVVLDLGRLPSHGNAIATSLRARKATRTLPLVFVPGAKDKTAAIRARFPDAVFAPWPRIASAVKRAIASPPSAPVVPAGPDYSGTPLPKKLGIRAGSRVAFVRAPAEFARALGKLPAGVVRAPKLRADLDVVVLFCRSLQELRADFAGAARCLADRGGLWVAWPKKASRVLTDLDDNVVRAVGLDAGLVDNKVCAIDAVWSGCRFARRRKPQPG